jgi:hypothetical protein
MPTKKNMPNEELLPISLTQQQREAMIHGTRLKAAIRRKIAEAGDGTQVITFTKKELDHLEKEIGTAAVYAPSPYKKHLVAAQKKVAEMVQECQPVSAQGSTRRRRPPAKSDLLFQFRITLLDIKPAIWRRIQVQDGTLADLHNHIQAAFGWWNYHLHMFEMDGLQYGPPPEDDFDDGLEMEDDTTVILSQLLPKSGKRTRWMYEYDFGDGWRHEILFEGYPPLDPKAKYPLYLEGERACPPEDCGGPFGFSEYVEAMANPRSKRHKELMQWRGPFDPLAFDPKKATRKMRNGRTDTVS